MTLGCRSVGLAWASGGLAWLAGCALPAGAAAPREQHQWVLDQLVFHADPAMPQQHRLFEELRAQRHDLANRLALPVSEEPIHVHLFSSDKQYQRFVRARYPGLSDRRAFFVESDTQLTVYAQWGDRVAEDLRHEVAHGYLHSVVTGVPLWLDEGLAEYFEPPRARRGLNAPHVQLLMAMWDQGLWQPHASRLASLTSTSEMKQQDYAEAWAWVHWLLETESSRRTALQTYLVDLRTEGSTVSLIASAGLDTATARQSLVAHLMALRTATWPQAPGLSRDASPAVAIPYNPPNSAENPGAGRAAPGSPAG